MSIESVFDRSVASAHRRAYDRLPVRRRGKSDPPAMVLTKTPSLWMLRTTARNRVGNQLARTPGGESAATALAAPSNPIYPLRSSRREQVADPGPPGEPPHVCEVTTVWLGRSDWSRRDTRQRAKRLASGPIGGGGDSPVTHRAPRYRHDCAPSRGSNQPPPSSSVRADEPFFSASARRISSELRQDLAVALAKAGAATTRSEGPATPLSLRLGAPVSQRYRDVEDASRR